MIGLPSGVIKDFSKLVKSGASPVQKSKTFVYGTVHTDGEEMYLQIDGSSEQTYMDSVTKYADGDRVVAVIENHRALITGNITSPAATERDAQEIMDVADGASEAAGAAKQAANTATEAAETATKAANTSTKNVAEMQQRMDSGEFKGEDATVLRIDSTRGTVFKNNSVSTVLKVIIYTGGEQITNITALRAKYGSGAHLQWYWQKIDETDYGIIVASDHKLSDDGFSLTLTPEEVDTKVTFRCELLTS